MKKIFRLHGKFEVHVEGQLLIGEVEGPWNRELVEYWAQQSKTLLAEFNAQRPYMAITTMHGSMLCPPDALERIGQAVKYGNQHFHCKGNLIVAAKGVDGVDLVRSAYAKIGITQFFQTLDEAKDYASCVLAKHDMISSP